MKSVIARELILVILFISNISYAQTVSYNHKPLTTKWCQVKYSIIKQDTTYFIIATLKSERLSFLQEPTMLLKTYDGDVLKLDGRLVREGSESAGVVVANVIVPVTEITSAAQFKISPWQMELLQKGISKVRLSTIPTIHERTFSKDKIGKKLYKFYKDLENNEF